MDEKTYSTLARTLSQGYVDRRRGGATPEFKNRSA